MDSFLQQLTRGNAIYLIIVTGIGGTFQSGYHIAGLSSPSPFIQRFVNSSWFARYGEVPPPHTTTMIWSLIVSMFAVGGFLGLPVLESCLPSLEGERKKAMMCSSCIAIVAAVVILTSKMVASFEMVIVARVLHGFSGGLGSSIHLLYLGEISPRKIRGMVTFTVTTFNCLGKLSGQLFGLSEILGREELWHVLLCVPACLAVVNILLLPLFPEAPRYLFIEKGDETACKKALQSLWGPGDYKEEMEEMLVEQAAIEAAPPTTPLQLLRSRRARWALFTLFLIVTCNQMSGMAVSTFSYNLFYKAGMPKDRIRYVTLTIGAAEITTSLFGGSLMDYFGRRPLFCCGYGVMVVSWVLITVTVWFQDSAYWVPYLTVVFVVMVIVSFCGGPGGSVNTLNAEIFVQSERTAAVVMVGMQRWLMYGLMGLIFPFLIVALSSYCYVLFACSCLVGCLYTFFILPETKGKTVLEISEEFGAMSVCGMAAAKNKEPLETAL
uniref:Solute carrier family 2, facilitated glucose transporter member 5 n=1 Tax=Neogobius melanostomus TaxID=47308 RepID=A0A8C6WY80_9GOBI